MIREHSRIHCRWHFASGHCLFNPAYNIVATALMNSYDNAFELRVWRHGVKPEAVEGLHMFRRIFTEFNVGIQRCSYSLVTKAICQFRKPFIANRPEDKIKKASQALITRGFCTDWLKISPIEEYLSRKQNSQHPPPQSFLTDQHPSPDSTFAAGKLIDQRELCLGVDGEVISPIKVTLESDGGYLEDDYKLGKVFRDRGVTTIMPDNKMAPLIKG